MECVRLIANPQHLKYEDDDNINEDKSNIKSKKISLADYLNDNYKDIYLSEHNIKSINTIINYHIKEINNLRIINSVLDNVIEKVIENSYKFDFCLPFD